MNDSLVPYISLADAQIEIQRRWNDRTLRSKVDSYLYGIPSQFHTEPRSVLFRNIISATTELELFLEQSNEIGLKPLGIEYINDKFSTRNADKMMLLKLMLIQGKDKHGNDIVVNKKIADIKASDNRTFADIKTFDGESLTDFHHTIVSKKFNFQIEITDFSEWLLENGDVASEYYRRFLTLFICHGVLFETFVTNESESEFAQKVVKPSIEFVTKFFGVPPLIVQNLPTPEDIHWLCYPQDILE